MGEVVCYVVNTFGFLVCDQFFVVASLLDEVVFHSLLGLGFLMGVMGGMGEMGVMGVM